MPLRTLDRVRRFAATDESLLLQGERGTGKTHLAEWIHRHSRRAPGPFRIVSVAGLDDGLANSELFGHVPGAFSGAVTAREGAFASAHHGTLLLDEIGKASQAVQRKLLDVIERRTYRMVGSDRDVRSDARLIFAANESLEALVSKGEMLADFLPRLGLFSIALPPLRERRDEIPVILRRLVRRHAPSFGWSPDNPPRIDPSLDEALAGHPWPENARGLENLVRRLLTDAGPRDTLSADLLVEDLAAFDSRALSSCERREAKARMVRDALARNGGNRSDAARALGISRSTLYVYLDEDPTTERTASA